MNRQSIAPVIHDLQQARRVFERMVRTGEHHGRFSRPAGLAIFTAHNYPTKSLLERNLDYLGIEGYSVLNRPVSTWSNSLRILWFLEYLTSDRCASPFVMYCDADDAVLRDDPRKIVEAFLEFECDVLFCSTRWPHGYQCMPDVKQWADTVHPGRYLNGGVCIGRRESLIEVYRRVASFVTPADADANPDSAAFYRNELSYLCDFPLGVGCDQTILRYLEPEFYPRLKIDADSRVFWRNSSRTALATAALQIKRHLPLPIRHAARRAACFVRSRKQQDWQQER